VEAKGSGFWIGTAAASICGTLAAVLSALMPESTIQRALHISTEWARLLIMIAYLIALGASMGGFLSMMAVGVREVGSLQIGSTRIPAWAHAAICIAAYLVPWTLVLVGILAVMTAGI